MSAQGAGNSAATVPEQSVKSICSFCRAASEIDFSEKSRPIGECPSCGASWRDRALLEILFGLECIPSVPTFRALREHLVGKGARLAVMGRLFDRPNTELPVMLHNFDHLMFPRGRRSLRPRFPVRANSVDYIIVAKAQDLIFAMPSMTAALRPGGAMIVTGGFKWPIPSVGEEYVAEPDEVQGWRGIADPLADARATGCRVWLDKPGLGIHVLQREAFMIVLKPDGTSGRSR